ncbi:MAG TPA: response regulator [Bryobacteraceae bacterium]|nr:response regulator [Bryobacteraceae bacterium]
MSVLFLFLLAGIAELGISETLVIGTTCALVQCFWRTSVRPRVVQVLFSVANIALAVTAADAVYHWPLLLAANFQSPFRLALAASVFFVVNTFPVATVIALTERKSIRQVWPQCYCWSFPYYLIGAAIVGVFSFTNRRLDWQAWLLILPVVYVIYRSYYLYLDQLQAERRYADEQRRHAEEVASLHGQTTDALMEAVSARARLEAVFQASPLAMFALDREGLLISWNAMAERMFGWTAREVLGGPLPSIAGQSGEAGKTLVEHTLAGEALSGQEAAQFRKNGTSFEAAIWTAALRDPAEKNSGILVTVADVSDRKRLEEQLRLSQKMEAIGRLAGGVAHDFNNLLTIINGYSSLLVDALRDDAYARSQAEEILSSGTRAAELVSQLLTFSRRQLIKPTPIEINRLVRDVERMLRRLIGEHIDCRTRLAPDAGWIRADRNQMEAVLINLATNARDAMPNGGVLSIETSRVEVAAGSEPDLPEGWYVHLVVRDTGQGMDAQTREHLFEPFFTTKATGKGTGLGLSTVYGGVEQNRGRIFVDSAPGKGTSFSIYLPAFETGGEGMVGHGRPEVRVAGTETVLLVEDEAAVRRMLREALTHAGYRVWEAGNGVEAVEQWADRSDEIDLLVTDIVMPAMNGLRLAEELLTRSPRLRVLFMSGHADEVINNQGISDASPDYLAKPFAPQMLVSKVREVLDRPAEVRAARAVQR